MNHDSHHRITGGLYEDNEHELYSDRELTARRTAQSEAHKQSFRKLVVGALVGATLLAGGDLAVRVVSNRVAHHNQEVHKAQEPIENGIQQNIADHNIGDQSLR